MTIKLGNVSKLYHLTQEGTLRHQYSRYIYQDYTLKVHTTSILLSGPL